MIDLSSLHTFIDRLSKREKAILYVSVIFVSLCLVDRLMVAPSFARMRWLDEEIKKNKLIIKKNLHFLSLRNKINLETKKYSSYFSKERSPDEEMNSLLKLIEDLARRAYVDLIYIKPAGFKSEKMQERYYIDLTCQGDMLKVVNFIYRVENSNKLLSIEKLAISPDSEGSSLVQCRITISKISIL